MRNRHQSSKFILRLIKLTRQSRIIVIASISVHSKRTPKVLWKQESSSILWWRCTNINSRIWTGILWCHINQSTQMRQRCFWNSLCLILWLMHLLLLLLLLLAWCRTFGRTTFQLTVQQIGWGEFISCLEIIKWRKIHYSSLILVINM